MDISGFVEIAAPVRRVRNAIQKRENLVHFLTPGSILGERPDQGFDFIVQRNFGPVSIRLSGVLTVTPDPTRDGLFLIAKAGHILGGSVELNLSMTFSGDAQTSKIVYAGTLEAGGLAGKVLGDSTSKVQSKMDQAFASFGLRMQRSQRAHETHKAENWQALPKGPLRPEGA